MNQNSSATVRVTVVMGAVLAAFGAPSQAQQADAPQAQRIEITGSSIRRIDGETAAPVQVLKREDIEKSGVSSVEQLMRSVSAMVSSNATAAASSSGAATGGISTISLRGLTADRTLVLVNGKRIAPFGAPTSSVAVDVDSIPIAAIERVEILKDGASAVYGSDAIAGVVNFILRKTFTGIELSTGYGASTSDGKGEIKKASVLLGFGDYTAERFNIMVQASAQKDGALFGADREFAKRTIRIDKDNNAGSSRTAPGNIGIPGFGLFNPRVDGAAGTGNCGPASAYVPEAGADICLFDPGPFVGLVPRTDRANVNASARLAMSDTLELYAEAGWGQKKAQTVIQPSPIDAAFGSPFVLTTASPFYPTAFVQGITGGATPNLNVRYRPFIIGNRDLTDTGTSTRLLLGGQGSVASWDYDLSLLRTTSQVKERINGGYFRVADDASGPGVVPLLSGQVRGANGQTLWVDPFGESSADVVAAARATNFLGQAFKTNTFLNSAQAKASRELARLDGGTLAAAFGLELRREGFKLDSNPALGAGNISGYGGNFVDIDVSRPMRALSAELNAPISKALTIDVAARYDQYASTTSPAEIATARTSLVALESAPSADKLPQGVIDRIAGESVGSAPSFGKATGKVGVRYQAGAQWILRATYSTGFRAPSLLDLYGPLQAGVSPVINDPLRCRGADAQNANFCATQFNIYAGGNSRLKPEEASSATIGMVFEPSRTLTLGVDFFATTVKNLIAIQSVDYLLNNEATLPGKVTRGSNNEIIAIDQRSENLGKVKIGGVDFDIRGQYMAEFGKLGLTWSATYMSKWDGQNPDGSFTGNIGQTSRAVTGFIPRLRHSTGFTFDRGPWAIAAQYNWQSGGIDDCGNLVRDEFGNCAPGTLPRFGAYETVDAQLKYSGIKNLALVFGVRNLFDHDPPYVNGAGGAFQGGYDPTYVDPRGRFAYVQLQYKFH